MLRGDTAWGDPGFFHPWSGVLGYSDTFLLESVVFVPWRLLGAEPLLAAQLTVITLSVVGFAGWWAFLGRLGLVDRPWTRLGLTVLATFPHQLAQQVLHQQLLSVWWLPWTLVLGHVAWGTTSTRRRLLAVSAAGLSWGLVLSSTVYVGWFVLFVAGLLVVVLGIGELTAGRMRSAALLVRRQSVAVGAALLGFVVGLVPFALVYLPVLGDRGQRTYAEVAQFGPRPFDLLNTGGGNLLWGSLLDRVVPGDPQRLDDIEVAMAVSPFLLLVAGLVWWRMSRRNGEGPEDVGLGRRRLVGAMLLVAAVAIVLPVEWGPFSLWRGVFEVVPGAGALRVAGRLWIVAHVLVVVAIAVALASRARGIDPSTARSRHWVTALVVCLLAAEQVDLVDRASLDRGADLALVASAGSPPGWCEVMAVRGGDTSWSFIGPSVDAMRISGARGLPTVHGYSGMLAPGYPIHHDGPRYERRFTAYMRRLAIDEPVCVFDLDARQWLDEPLDVG
ncbi:MAG: hypothetical protein RJB65_1482 [Actinomycetota bacterium]